MPDLDLELEQLLRSQGAPQRPLSKPSAQLGRLWFSAADVRTVEAMRPLVAHVQEALLAVPPSAEKRGIVYASLDLLTKLYRYEGRDPEPESLVLNYVRQSQRQHPDPVSWDCVQDSVSNLQKAFQAAGL